MSAPRWSDVERVFPPLRRGPRQRAHSHQPVEVRLK